MAHPFPVLYTSLLILSISHSLSTISFNFPSIVLSTGAPVHKFHHCYHQSHQNLSFVLIISHRPVWPNQFFIQCLCTFIKHGGTNIQFIQASVIFASDFDPVSFLPVDFLSRLLFSLVFVYQPLLLHKIPRKNR